MPFHVTKFSQRQSDNKKCNYKVLESATKILFNAILGAYDEISTTRNTNCPLSLLERKNLKRSLMSNSKQVIVTGDESAH
jgi:hypothetical protein